MPGPLDRPTAPDPYSLLPKVDSFTVTSTDVADGQPMGLEQAHPMANPDAGNASPQLSWEGAPEGTQGYAVTCFDPDAPTPCGFWHWIVLDLPADTTSLDTNAGADGATLPGNAFTARNDFGSSDFGGEIVHPQHWPEDLDYRGKRVVVIGSGATAVSLIPSLAEQAEHVTMLQRSPSYIFSSKQKQYLAPLVQKLLPPQAAHKVIRTRYAAQTAAIVHLTHRFPSLGRKMIRSNVAQHLPEDYPIDVHFNPPYNPWDQRMCMVPDADLFADKGRQGGHVTVGVIGAQQRNVALLIEVPVILLDGRILRRREHQIGEKPCGPAISINERMNTDRLGMHGDAQLPRRPVIGMRPPIGDGVECIAQLDSDLFGSDTDADLQLSLPTAPLPDGPEQAPVEIADEVVAQQLVKRQ